VTVSSHSFAESVLDSCVSGAHLYMANSYDGLQIYKIMGYDWEVPAMPRNVTATGGKDNVTIQWTIPSSIGHYPIDGYSIYRGVLLRR